MASGFGYTGGRSRCFTYWQEFSKCYAQTDAPSECRPQVNDYLECLHHPQEIARAKVVEKELIRKAQSAATEGRKAADILADGAVVGVGLIKRSKEEETK
ncbi:hypothetical protein BDQ12DRAFT_728754 [Crucibulum laeve]|uniref:NADH dehydrogenase [ubiquinone] iron-sulfur protein 5 n=1 Tax=Crucibulum laeve TaxID=68775 RepID=A0A5C3LHS4_9AGAR|nr:hypothetical protein BDQ12DRAFT_728754 [Crucibulum laeve]